MASWASRSCSIATTRWASSLSEMSHRGPRVVGDSVLHGGRSRVARPIEQAPAWVRELASSHQDLAAQHAEAEALLDAVRRGDRSAVVTVEELIRELDALDDAKDPEP